MIVTVAWSGRSALSTTSARVAGSTTAANAPTGDGRTVPAGAAVTVGESAAAAGAMVGGGASDLSDEHAVTSRIASVTTA